MARTYQKIYERTGVDEYRQKVLFHLLVLEKEMLPNVGSSPSVKEAFEQYKNLKSYVENMNKPRFWEKRKEIAALEATLKTCKTVSQTIFYRSKIIASLEKLNNQLPEKSPLLELELAQSYLEQALAQVDNRNYKEVEANAQKALALDTSNDNLIALLATAQWLQNKKPMVQETYKMVKDSHLIFRTMSDFEKKGIEKGVFDPLRVDFERKKGEL